MNREISAIALQVTEAMKKRGVIVHRYDSYTTNSVYLKFDYGAAYSLRISDHKGKKHLKYRFNIEMDLKDLKTERRGKCFMEFFPAEKVSYCISRILTVRQMRQESVDNYQALMDWYRDKGQRSPGFWEQAKQV